MSNKEVIFEARGYEYQVYQADGSSKWQARRKSKKTSAHNNYGKYDTREQAITALEKRRPKAPRFA